MSKVLNLKQLSKYLADQMKQLGSMRDEVEEIQVGFNAAYVEWRADHDAALERLTAAISEDFGSISPQLAGLILERKVEEERIVAERIRELNDKLIPKTQQAADEALDQGQELTAKLKETNPRLDAREEKLKRRRMNLENQLADLNRQIKELSGCLGVFLNYFKISKIDRQRQKVIGKLEDANKDLKEVRVEWETIQKETASDQTDFQALWQEYTLELAKLQAEYDFLDEPKNAEDLAMRRAIRHTIDELKEQVPAGIEDLQSTLDDMVEFNIQTDTYHEGLGAVGGILGMLDGLIEGFKRFNESVKGLIDQQEMHSAYLSDLHIAVGDRVFAFCQQFEGLEARVKDDAHLTANPREFIDAVEPFVAEALSEEKVQSIFNSLGNSLSSATKEWD
jgi:chromosome segregation ATPase